ncbi:MrpH family fimbial adhesin [Photorhabdus laumondii]|uniref:MrpH family fimbial adhesin n=1 Tax=Photorhabdus laumondii TaxID=2218628 RepID=UPI003315FF0E
MRGFFYLVFFMALAGVPFIEANARAFVTPIRMEKDWDGIPRVIQEINSWDENDTDPNPCHGSSVCYVGPDVRYIQGLPGMYGSCIDERHCIEISGLATKKEVADAYKKNFPLPYRADFRLIHDNASCIGLFFIKHQPVMGYSDAQQWPGSNCGKLPPANQSCNIFLPPVIDHGNLGQENLNGNKKTITGNVQCTLPANLTLYTKSSTGEKFIYLNPEKTLYSDVDINGSNAWNGVPITVSGNNLYSFSFSSRLQSLGKVGAGAYSGDVIVIMAFN